MVKALVLLATGTEPAEAIVPADFLIRAGAEVITAAVGTESTIVNLDPYLKVTADVLFNDVKTQIYDVIIVPGGDPGTSNLANNADVIAAINAHYAAGKLVASICAAPGMVLAEKCQILTGKKACGYPGTDDLIAKHGGTKTTDNVVVDGNIITSRGPGTATLFGIAVVRYLFGDEKADQINSGMLIY